MGFLPFVLQCIPITILSVLHIFAIAQQNPVDNTAEINALYGLKASFKESQRIQTNWTGIVCNGSDPSRWLGVECPNGRVTGITLEDMNLTGNISNEAFFDLEELAFLNFKNNSLGGHVMDFSKNHKLRVVDLSGNQFTGPISPSFLRLDLLETLFLQNNNLSGSIPEFNQPNLIQFNVSNNYFEGRIPKTPKLQSFGPDSYSGNLNLCGPPSPNTCRTNADSSSPELANQTNNSSQNDQSESPKKNDNSLVSYVMNVVLIIAVIVLLYLNWKTTQKLNKMMKGKIPTDEEEMESEEEKVEIGEGTVMTVEERKELVFFKDEPKFQMGDLLKASAESLGQGTMGNSYKAMLNDGPTIVVKRLRDLKPMDKEEFMRIMLLISDLQHPNLLPPIAFYYSKDEKLLLYKYAENGSLFLRLHAGRDGTRIPFKWSSRLSVARGIARALEYLHLNTKVNNIVPHGNLKTSNVLLGKNNTVFVADYGLSSLVAQPIAAQSMVVYKSPDYGYARRVTKQSDVWSYGCLLIELLTGKISATSAPPGVCGVDLGSWVQRAVREEWTAEIFDKEIPGRTGALDGMLRLLQIAMRCIERFPENRPEISEVAREVEKIQAPLASEEDEDLSSLTDDSLSISSISANVGD
ncbi:hypothetical protein L6164_036312 [Bauhinia variegata]|uniref:Uncharacterized protein n=1 Tax=Bauhinia variegata TaxID=167791 RepID=A0ACB9KGQ1_BAUVA|nr:hypothetical protein L6164_036312 [Bauhinia variegata]